MLWKFFTKYYHRFSGAVYISYSVNNYKILNETSVPKPYFNNIADTFHETWSKRVFQEILRLFLWQPFKETDCLNYSANI